jgi:integrase
MIDAIEENPIEHTILPIKEKRKLPHYLTNEQMSQIYRLASEIRITKTGGWTLREPIILAAKSGLTINEIQLIKWTNFDFGGKLLMTYRPKTNKTRTIPLHRMIIETFEPRKLPDGHVFACWGGPYCLGSWHKWMDKLQRVIPDLKGWHDFRRSFAVNLSKAGVPPVEIMHYLGHSNLTTTMRYMDWQPSNYNPNIENA